MAVFTFAGPTVARVLLVDPSGPFRLGLRQAIEREPGISVVGEAETAAVAAGLAQALRPDVAVVASNLPDASAFGACQQLLADVPDLAVLVLGDLDWDVHVAGAWAVGAAGYLLRSAATREILEAIRQAPEGLVFTSEQRRRVEVWAREVGEPLARLAPRERDVLRQVALGGSNRAVGEVLGLAEHTIEKHVGSTLQKLGASSRTGLLAFILRHHLEEMKEPFLWRKSATQRWRSPVITFDR